MTIVAVVGFAIFAVGYGTPKVVIVSAGAAMLVLVLFNMKLPLGIGLACVVAAGNSLATGALLSQRLLSEFVVIGVYGAGVWWVNRVRSSRPGPVAESVAYVAALGVIGPAVAGITARLLPGAAGGITETIAFDVGLQHAVATLVVVPFVISLARREHEQLWASVRGWTATAALAVGALTWYGTASGTPLLVLFATLPIVVAASRLGRASPRVLTVTALVGATLGGSAASSMLDVQLMLVASAAIGLLVSSLRMGTAESTRTRERVVTSGGIELMGMDDHREQVSGSLRWLRSGLMVLVLIRALADLNGLESGAESLSIWVVTGVTGGVLVLLNELSRWFDAVLGESERRQWIEVALDAVAVVILSTVVAPNTPFQDLPYGILLVSLHASLRLQIVPAIAVATSAIGLIALVRFSHVVPWARLPADHTPGRAVVEVALVASLTFLVAKVVGELGKQRDHAAAIAADLDESQQLVAAQQLILDAENRLVLVQGEQLQRRHDELRRSHEALGRSREQLQQFSAIVAHDLRSPISTAYMLATALPTLPEERRTGIAARVAPSLERALDLIERLHSHARASTSELEVELLDLNEILRGVLDDHALAIADAGILVRHGEVLPPAFGDAVLVGQVLGNLVTNAVRYGRGAAAEPQIAIRGVQDVDGVVVVVEDNGPGIPVGSEHRLFEAGEHGDDDRRGVGLGLATCRQVVERHGGHIGVVASRLGGAAFEFSLPTPVPNVPHALVVDELDGVDVAPM